MRKHVPEWDIDSFLGGGSIVICFANQILVLVAWNFVDPPLGFHNFLRRPLVELKS